MQRIVPFSEVVRLAESHIVKGQKCFGGFLGRLLAI